MFTFDKHSYFLMPNEMQQKKIRKYANTNCFLNLGVTPAEIPVTKFYFRFYIYLGKKKLRHFLQPILVCCAYEEKMLKEKGKNNISNAFIYINLHKNYGENAVLFQRNSMYFAFKFIQMNTMCDILNFNEKGI